jgi:hypothetical protein
MATERLCQCCDPRDSLPTSLLFYALIAIAIAVPVRDPMLAGLAWLYVALRWGHAVVHLAFNRLYVRTPIFMLGNLVLLAMWLILAITMLS